MKKILVVLTLMFAFAISNAQFGTSNQVKTKEVKGNLTTYRTTNGCEISIGDTLIIGIPANNGGLFINLIDRTKLWTKSNYESANVTADNTGGIGIIKRMRGYGRKLYLTTYANGESKGMNIKNLESAISMGEIRIKGEKTKGEALKELKDAKSQLELEIITQEEYNKIKSQLIKYIK